MQHCIFALFGKNTKFNCIAGRLFMAFVVGEDLSKRINSLRFLLIVFVVIIHNGISAESFTARNVKAEIPAYVENIQRSVGIITSIGVPLFFLFSAYLLYIKEQQYITVLKKKCRTILLPYFLWNLLLVLFYFLMQSLPYVKEIFSSSPERMIRSYSVIDWIDVFVGKFTERREFKYPFVYQFWFLRDLFILNIFFIGIKKLADKFPLGVFVLFLILWINNINIYIVSTEALLFFTLGYYIVKYSLNIESIDQIKTMDLSVIYGITIILEYFFINSMPVLHKVNIIIGCIFFLKISLFVINNIRLYKILAWQEKYQFFVYAIHGIIISQLQKVYIRMVPLTGVFILLGYFFMILFGVIISLISGIIFKKLFPKIYGILTGGRV